MLFRSTAFDRLWVIPSEVDLCGADLELVRMENHLHRVRLGLEPIRASGQFEHAAHLKFRMACQRRAWHHQWWRRVMYFATVAVTIALLVAPLLRHNGGNGRWASYYHQHPLPLIAGVAAIACVRWCSSQLQRAVDDQMHVAWRGLRPVALTPA